MEKNILVMSDEHCGHRLGLTHPKFQHKVSDDATHMLKKYMRTRRDLWNWFSSAIKSLPPIDVLINNGDAIDGQGERSGGTEMITTDREQQVDMAIEVLKFVNAKKIYMVFGTASHVGKEEDWESIIATKIGAAKIENQGNYDINGLSICAKHQIGNSSSPVSSFTAIRSSQIKNMLWKARGQQPLANLLIRSHIHRCYGIVEPAMNFQGWVTPALQGLGSKYGARQIDGLPVDFGFLLVQIRSKTNWNVIPYIAPAKLEECEVTVL